MKITKEEIAKIRQSAIAERDALLCNANKQLGAISLCEWMLSNFEFQEEGKKEEVESASL